MWLICSVLTLIMISDKKIKHPRHHRSVELRPTYLCFDRPRRAPKRRLPRPQFRGKTSAAYPARGSFSMISHYRGLSAARRYRHHRVAAATGQDYVPDKECYRNDDDRMLPIAITTKR